MRSIGHHCLALGATHMEQPIQGVQEWRHPLTHTYGFRKPKFSLKWGNAPIKSYDGGKAFKSQVAVPPFKYSFPISHCPSHSLIHSFIAIHLGSMQGTFRNRGILYANIIQAVNVDCCKIILNFYFHHHVV